MQKYLIHADKRRPLRFEGVLLGTSTAKSDEELKKQVVEEGKKNLQVTAEHGISLLRLSLYKTRGGKIVLETVRFGAQFGDEFGSETVWATTPSISVDVFDSFEVYIEKAIKQGRVTVALLENVIENHPELEVFWVESID